MKISMQQIQVQDRDNYLEYLRELEDHHYLFYYLWQMGEPEFTENIETAAVKFANGQFAGFIFNPHFWNSLSRYERKFIICHECLHLTLNHGMRSVSLDKGYRQIANIAMDIVVNELLVYMFGFDREKITIEACWADILGADTPTDQNFEYYFNLLKDQAKEVPYFAIDQHEGFEGQSTDDMFDEIDCSEVEDLLEEVREHVAGSCPGGFMKIIKFKSVPKKKKWETVIRKWYKKRSKEKMQMITHWLDDNRRNSLLCSDLMLPYEKEVAPKYVRKLTLWCFQDTSGSCRYDAERFFNALRSIPTRYFDLRLFCFDTKVYETSLKTGKLYGFGGTTFSCIEAAINDLIRKERCQYPQAIFVFTDGFGNNVYPKHPDRWHWFLKPNGFTGYIPKESRVFNLAEYE